MSLKCVAVAAILIFTGLFFSPAPAKAAWNTEVADGSTCVGVDTQMTLDPLGHPHIVHYDSTNTALRHTWHNGEAWQTEIVDVAEDCGEEPGIAIDSAGIVHAVYLARDQLRYARKEAGAWTLSVIHQGQGLRFGGSSIALGPLAEPHVSYSVSLDDGDNDGGGGENDEGIDETLGLDFPVTGVTVIHGWLDNGIWQLEKAGLRGSDTDIALDSTGRVFISYKWEPEGGRSVIVCAHNSGGSWQVDNFDPATAIGTPSGRGDTRLAVDGQDHVHVVYRDWANGALKYGYWNTLEWTAEVVAQNIGSIEGVDIAVDGFFRPHLAFNGYDPNESRAAIQTAGPQSQPRDDEFDGRMFVRYAVKTGGVWFVEELPWGGNPGIAVTTEGLPHIGQGASAEGLVPPPWSVPDCEVLRYNVRSAIP